MKLKQCLRQNYDVWHGKAIRKLLGGAVAGVLVETRQGKFIVDPEDRAVSKTLIQNAAYGQHEIDQLSALIRPDDTLCVVGTHVGALLIPLSKLCRESIGIEANPVTYQLLEMNLLLNGCHNVAIHNCAANDRETEMEFVLNRTNSGGSKRMPLVKKDIYFHDTPEVIKVKAVRLDDLLGAKKVDVVIMDIEGSEYFALKGMEHHLKDVRVLQLEFLPHHLKNVAGVSVAELLAPVTPYFSSMTVPSKGLKVESAAILQTLEKMYSLGEEDEGLLFEK